MRRTLGFWIGAYYVHWSLFLENVRRKMIKESQCIMNNTKIGSCSVNDEKSLVVINLFLICRS